MSTSRYAPLTWKHQTQQFLRRILRSVGFKGPPSWGNNSFQLQMMGSTDLRSSRRFLCRFKTGLNWGLMCSSWDVMLVSNSCNINLGALHWQVFTLQGTFLWFAVLNRGGEMQLVADNTIISVFHVFDQLSFLRHSLLGSCSQQLLPLAANKQRLRWCEEMDEAGLSQSPFAAHCLFIEPQQVKVTDTRQVDLFSKRLLLVPIHLEVHWCLVAANNIKKKICLYDSQGVALQKVARVSGALLCPCLGSWWGPSPDTLLLWLFVRR